MINETEKIEFMASLPPIQLEKTFLSGSKDRVIREVLVLTYVAALGCEISNQFLKELIILKNCFYKNNKPK